MREASSSRGTGRASQELKLGVDARRRMIDFYRLRDREDAERCASGAQRGRTQVYADCIARLEGDDAVYESYELVQAAGIELSDEVLAALGALPHDWRLVCRIDHDGGIWTASLQEKKAIVR